MPTKKNHRQSDLRASAGAAGTTAPLSAMLSQALVAFIIEFDNEFEHQTPHRTANFGPTPGAINPPFLVSMVLWVKFLRFIPEDAILVSEFQRLAGLSSADTRRWVARMSKWWNYVRVESGGAQAGADRRQVNGMIRPTLGGRKALEVWRPLTGAIERRWEERFGKNLIDDLRASLRKVIDRFDERLPSSLPILGYGLFTKQAETKERLPAADDPSFDHAIPTLLSKTLFAFAVEYESESEVSLAISANVLRLVQDEGIRAADLPVLAGVSKEAIAISLSFLQKRGFASVQREASGSPARILTLTAKGCHAREQYFELLPSIEERWDERCGKNAIGALRRSLESLARDGTAQSPLFRGLKPYPDNWRAAIRKAENLPHYPMILHRGGYPDGS